ncbi:hypothetical protein C8R47DRAFT_1085244 [Mycena vitilis]|nr:hypothetical protein C8R47DRAFT_1085244 [Mycena vitilis]
MAEYRRLKANYRPPPPSRHYPDGTPPDYILPGFDTPSLLEPHLDFSFEQRLREELDIRDPPLAFPGNALPHEAPEPPQPSQPSQPAKPRQRGMRVLNGQLKAQQKARKQAYDAAMRETRFRKAQGGYLAQRTAFGPAPEAAAVMSPNGLVTGLI